MRKFIDALMNKKTIHSSPSMFTGTSIATEGQPVPVGYMIQPPSELTSGSSLNHSATGAWPDMIDGGAKFWTIGGWRKNLLKEVSAKNIPGNYGSIGSLALYGFNYRAYDGIGNYPNEGAPVPFVKEYNELTPVVWGGRVSNPNTRTNTTQQKGSISIQTKPSTWQGSNTASLTRNGVVLQ